MNNKFLTITLIIPMIIIGIMGTFNVSSIQTNQIVNNDFFFEENKQWLKNNPESLPIWLTSEELLRLDEIGINFESTSAPPTPIRQPAEFEPMQGVLIRYPFGISYQIIAEMSEDVEVVTIVEDNSDKSFVISQYQNYGVNIDNCDFLIAPSNSYWTRDYGPWFMFNGEDEQGIIDFIYNRPRPDDNLIPSKFGTEYNIPVYSINLEHAGGNYMTDGQGIAVSTDLVWNENPGYSHEQIEQMLEDYCGIETYHVVPDALGAYINHIDCWAKFLAPNVIMIIETSPSHSHYDDIEEAVEYFENQTSCYGTPYKIERVYTHLSEPYINCLILNKKVLVPLTGSQWDDDAIDSFEAAMPGYEILGFYGSWKSTDALHCRTKGIVDRYMLYIKHTPLTGIQASHEGFEIKTMIFPYSGEDVNTAKVFYRVDGSSWQDINMEVLGNNQFNAIIPQQLTGTIIEYFIYAEDDSGRIENHPYIGSSWAHSFTCELINEPPVEPMINGTTKGTTGQDYDFSFTSTDPENDGIYYKIDWGDGEVEDWFGPFNSSEQITLSHSWDKIGTFTIKAKTKDNFDYESDWKIFTIKMSKYKFLNIKLLDFFPTTSYILYKNL